MIKKIPAYVFLLPTFVVLHVAAEFRGLINFEIVWPGILKIFVAQLAIFLFSRLFSNNIQKISLISFAFSLVYFFFPDLKDYLFSTYPHARLSSYSVLLPVILLLLMLIVRTVINNTR